MLSSCQYSSSRDKKEVLEEKAYRLAVEGRHSVSASIYNELIKMDSSNGAYYFGRADSYLMLLKLNESTKDYLKAIELNYLKGSCYFNLGLINCYTDDSTALDYFKKAIEIEPKMDKYRLEYEECLERLKVSKKITP